VPEVQGPTVGPGHGRPVGAVEPVGAGPDRFELEAVRGLADHDERPVRPPPEATGGGVAVEGLPRHTGQPRTMAAQPPSRATVPSCCRATGSHPTRTRATARRPRPPPGPPDAPAAPSPRAATAGNRPGGRARPAGAAHTGAAASLTGTSTRVCSSASAADPRATRSSASSGDPPAGPPGGGGPAPLLGGAVPFRGRRRGHRDRLPHVRRGHPHHPVRPGKARRLVAPAQAGDDLGAPVRGDRGAGELAAHPLPDVGLERRPLGVGHHLRHGLPPGVSPPADPSARSIGAPPAPATGAAPRRPAGQAIGPYSSRARAARSSGRATSRAVASAPTSPDGRCRRDQARTRRPRVSVRPATRGRGAS